MTTDVLVIRHAETFGNLEGRFCGHSETELTPRGIAQAAALGRRLSSSVFDIAASSDLSRALLTARHALNHHPTPPQLLLEPRLREMHYGEWESLPASEIARTQADLLREFFTGRCPAAPGGETIQQLRERTAAAFHELVAQFRGGRLLLVSHGNAIMALVSELFGIPQERTWGFVVANTAVSRITVSRSGRVTLASFNDTSHLEGVELP